MKAFISELLGYNNPGNSKLNRGVLGVVKAYYGCVEAQGRGTLHCHMMVWIEGGLNPKELQTRLRSMNEPDFGRRLITYLDDVISNGVPTVRFDMDLGGNDAALRNYRLKDLRELVEKNQRHKHTNTCYKYCKTGERTCRFDLDEGNVIPESSIDVESGELTLRICDGLINNYNETILEAVRCNMDIQFIGSGEEAKAVLYYITDYITKSPLKAHVAYAALEMALKKISSQPTVAGCDDQSKMRRLLQRTAFSILSNQELSAQQVASYLLDFEDHFTAHRFANLYWRSFEKFVDRVFPVDRERNSIELENTAISSEQSEEIDTQFADERDCDGDEEVRIDTDENGSVVELSNQLADYLYRGEDLAQMCLWDFVAQTQK
ncbi:hypothetical protein FKP32DRAFT_1528420, partial [Trametes sanguinea]